jgi:outer membrane immunogenic protein
MSSCKLLNLSVAMMMLALASAASDAAEPVVGAAYWPPPPLPFVYNWTGLYVGGHVGAGWSDGGSGFLGGGQVGYNYQINQWVLGVEADISGTTIRNSVSATVVGPGAVLTSGGNAGLDWVSTFAPRVGWASDGWLFYGKVGGAWAHASATANFAMNGFGAGSISVDQTVSGWVLGIGAEYALPYNWTAKVEYNMMNFGSNSAFSNDSFHVIKGGINYRFGGPGWLF